MSLCALEYPVIDSNENGDYFLAEFLQNEEWASDSNDVYEQDNVFAFKLHKHLNEASKSLVEKSDIFYIKGKKYNSLVDPELEVVDPTPDVWHLFRDFDQHFFNSTLVNKGVLLEWSKRMTRCAGVCQWRDGGQCSIRLSYPLLTLRQRSDLVETLLHEMIHAYLFVTKARDDESHGTKFHEHMYRINKEAKTCISVYHNFNDEVKYYQQHIWRCDGPCRTRGPYFGFVRRSMNRKPGPSDPWWESHRSCCTGNFMKISEPKDNKIHNNTKSSAKPSSNQPKIESFFNKRRGNSLTDSSENGSASLNKSFVPFSGKGYKLGTHSDNTFNSGKKKKFVSFSGQPAFLGKPLQKSNKTGIAESSDNKLYSVEDDVLITSFYENTDDDEFIRKIGIDGITSENKSYSVEDDDVLITSFYENTDDDEFIRNISIDVNQSQNSTTPSVRKYFPVINKKEVDIVQID